MNKIILSFLFLCAYSIVHGQSKHIPEDMGEDEVIVMKQGPFLNNSKNAIAIHKCKYEDIERNEMKIVKLNEENEELKKKMSDLLLLMEHLEFELSNCKERKKKRNR